MFDKPMIALSRGGATIGVILIYQHVLGIFPV